MLLNCIVFLLLICLVFIWLLVQPEEPEGNSFTSQTPVKCLTHNRCLTNTTYDAGPDSTLLFEHEGSKPHQLPVSPSRL